MPAPALARSKNFQRSAIVLMFVVSFLYVTGSFFVAIALGAVIAIVAHPLVARLEARDWGRRLASLIVTFGLTTAVLLPTAVLLFLGSRTAFSELKLMRLATDSGIGNLARSPAAQQLARALTRIFQLPEGALSQNLYRVIQDFAEFLSRLFENLVLQIPELAVGFVALVLAIYYFLVDGIDIVKFLRANSPFSKTSTDRMMHAAADASYSVLVATFFAALSQTALMIMGVWITSTPNAALVGLFTFLLAFLPIVGTTPISVGVVAFHLSTGDTGRALAMTAFGVAVSLIDNVVHLAVLKNRSNIHPLVGFVAVFGGLQVMGFSGIFLGPVLAAITLELIKVAPREIKTADGPSVPHSLFLKK